MPYSLERCEEPLKQLYDSVYQEINQNWKNENKAIKELGGLFVLGTERHETRRMIINYVVDQVDKVIRVHLNFLYP